MSLAIIPFLPPVSVLILAGGRATRMHGMDKGLQQINGESLVKRLVDQFKRHSDDILINANRSLTQYHNQFPATRIITDEWPDFRGPLAGMYSGLKQTKHDYMMVIPCDQFLVPESIISHLCNKLIHDQLDVVYVTINQQPIYPFCLLHKPALASLEKHINTQHYAVRHWLFTQRAGTVNFTTDPDLPINLNTPEQLQQATHFCQNQPLPASHNQQDTR